MRHNRKRWKRFRMVRVAEATLSRLDKLAPGARSLAEAVDEAVCSMAALKAKILDCEECLGAKRKPKK